MGDIRKKIVDGLNRAYLPKFVISLLLLLSIIFNATSFFFTSRDSLNEWVANFFQNIGVDFLGAIITYLLLENVIGGWKEKLQEEKETAIQLEESEKKRIEQQALAYQDLKNSTSVQQTQLLIEKMSLLGLFKDCKLSELKLNKLRFNKVDWTDSSLEKITFASSKLEDCTFNKAQLIKVSFILSELNNLIFDSALLFDVNFTESFLTQTRFAMCKLRDCAFIRAKIINSNFNYADLSYSDFSNSNLEGSSFVNSNLRGANLKGARLYNVDLLGADLQDVLLDVFTILPSGEQWTSSIDFNIYSKGNPKI